MDLIEALKAVGKAEEFEETFNYYFERHKCSGAERKIMMDFVVENEGARDILRFGICPVCGKVYYHRDIKTKYF